MASESGERMKLGFMPGMSEHGMGGDEPNGVTPRYRDTQQLARIAEDTGVDSFWLADHLTFRFPDSAEEGAWEVFTFLAGIAATTSRIQLGPLVACTSFRNPALLAKMAVGLDEISDGRFILGLGAGWHKPEYDAFGYPFDHLASRFEEALAIIIPALRDGHVDFQGKYYEARDMNLRPRGPSPKGPKIWIGAHQPRMLGLVAKYADAWNTVWHRFPDGVEKAYPTIKQACDEVGRDPATLELTAGTVIKLLKPGEAKQDDYKGIQGEPEEVATALRGFEAVGVKHLVVQVEGKDVRAAELFGQVVEFFHK